MGVKPVLFDFYGMSSNFLGCTNAFLLDGGTQGKYDKQFTFRQIMRKFRRAQDEGVARWITYLIDLPSQPVRSAKTSAKYVSVTSVSLSFTDML